MIAVWMTTATVFALLVGLTAVLGERALRIVGRQTRGVWFAALAASVAWPFAAPLAARWRPAAAASASTEMLPAVTSTIDAIVAFSPASERWATRLDDVLLALWAMASFALLIRLGVSLRRVAGITRDATRETIAGEQVLVTPSLGPAVFGFRTPRLLVPRWLFDLDAPLRALVVQHEREHLRARDAQVTLAVAVIVALVPWNAAVWWIARRLRVAMELDCDARVLRTTQAAERYGRLLLLIAQRQTPTNVASMLAESNPDLTRRIHQMNASRPTKARLRVGVLSALAIITLACSAKYGNDLATAPSATRTAFADVQQEVVDYFSPEGATPAKPVAFMGAPVYPAQLASARREGEVHAMFVIDSSGGVVPGSLKVVRASDSLFSVAVRDRINLMRFTPAEYNGRRVRQLVQQTFVFRMLDSERSAARVVRDPVGRPTSDPNNRNPMPLPSLVIVRQ
jgi:beta-lactamase regulating signal transducer with metallopeptidase domain